jgi:hypothetical protein
MDFSKIICIEVKKYNQKQLTKIAESLGFEANPSDEKFFNLLTCKVEKVEKVFIIPGESGPIAAQVKKDFGKKSQDPLYKDILFVYPQYRGLSKKEKEKLLKLKSFDFFKKEKNKDVKDVKIVLDLDTILDKIGEFGINSLLKEEKEFLDNISNS